MDALGVIFVIAGFFCIVNGVLIQLEENYYRVHPSASTSRYLRSARYTGASASQPPRSNSPPGRDWRQQTTPPEGGWQEPATGKPGDFANAQPGQTIAYQHPHRGKLEMHILGTIKYVELWQKQKSRDMPWVPTGNVFTAHWMGNDTLLYQWKGLLYLLDQLENLSDFDIKRNFLKPARKFGQSNETADVYFAFPPGSWKMIDIGKYRVNATQGEGLRLQKGALGRFLHAEGGTGLENRVLVVEDYQEGGGGLDTAWRGWQVSWDAILEIKSS